MIRKQVYLTTQQDTKVKAIASARGWSEAKVIRDAIDRLPDAAVSAVERLEAAGLLAPKVDDPDALTGAELEELEAEVYAWLDSLPAPLGLAEAVMADREGR